MCIQLRILNRAQPAICRAAGMTCWKVHSVVLCHLEVHDQDNVYPININKVDIILIVYLININEVGIILIMNLQVTGHVITGG